MTPVLILPGLGGSGPEHWQSRWEASDPSFERVHMPDWDEPDLESWVSALDAAVRKSPALPVIAAHSLGCLTLAHWATRGGALAAALLVAVPDPDAPTFPKQALGFGPVPLAPLPFASRVVASQNDPYGSFAFARSCARAWGSAFTDAGMAGHINAESGLGDWPEGRRLLAGLLR